MTTTITRTTEQEARRRRTVVWVVGLAFVGLVFDGYDLVVYGTVLSTFLRDPTQIGKVTPAVGGALGSYALVGVLVGALLAGTHRATSSAGARSCCWPTRGSPSAWLSPR